MAIAVSAQPGAESSPQTWFFGPGRDLLLGCGLIYLLVFVLLSVASSEVRWLARNVSRSFHGKNPNALDTLAVAHANAGRFSEAQRTAEHALKLARANRDEELAAHIEDRLALYRRELPYRER